MQVKPFATPSIAQIEAEVRRRFQALASQQVLYHETPTVGSDRDILSFKLEWWTMTGDLEAIAVHVDYLNGHITCYPPMPLDDETSLSWLDQLLARVPSS